MGQIRSLVLRDAIQDLRRFPRGQDCAASARFVTGRKDSAGNRLGPSGKNIGHAHLTGALSEAAPLCLRQHPAGQQLLGRVEKQHDKGQALSILAHTLGRAVSHRLKRTVAFDRDLLRRSSGGRGRAPDASLDLAGMSLTGACRGADLPVSMNATVGLGLRSLRPTPLIGHALWPLPSRCWAPQVPWTAPPPSLTLTGEFNPLSQAFAEDGTRGRPYC